MENEYDLLVALKIELAYFDQGNYDVPGAIPRLKALFVDSPSCPNFGDVERPYPCSSCTLLQLVDGQHKNAAVPCHHIALDSEGNTIASLCSKTDVSGLKKKFRAWLVSKIEEMEAASGSHVDREMQKSLRDAT